MVTEGQTKDELRARSSIIIQKIRASYLDRQEITHEEYHRQLNAEGMKLLDESELVTNFPPEPPRDLAAEIDKLKNWAKTKEFIE